MAPPLDLTTVTFTPFSNFVPNFVVDTLDSGADSGLSSIFNTGIVDTLSGNDWILANLRATIDTTDEVEVAGLLNTGTIFTSEGRDRVIGNARATGGDDDTDFDVSGIKSDTEGSLIDTGIGNDRVFGNARGTAGNNVNRVEVAGIELGRFASDTFGTIDTGDGKDIITGTATGKIGDDGRVEANGILGGTISTGAGRDTVTGIASATGGRDAEVLSTGIESHIDTGSGDDIVIGIGSVSTGDADEPLFSFTSADGISDVTITTGDGDDTGRDCQSLYERGRRQRPRHR